MRLLERVFRILKAAQHPVGVGGELPTERLDQLAKSVGVSSLCGREQGRFFFFEGER
jgi:hypothetical protein